MLIREKFGSAIPRFVLGACVVAGCAYHPDSFSYAREPFRGQYATIDCLDIAVEPHERALGSHVVTYEFGNRCDQPALVDLASAQVYARSIDGVPIQLVAYDPKGEIRPLRVDAHAHGREAIEYSSGDASGLCIDAASIARVSPPHWLCFGDRD